MMFSIHNPVGDCELRQPLDMDNVDIEYNVDAATHGPCMRRIDATRPSSGDDQDFTNRFKIEDPFRHSK